MFVGSLDDRWFIGWFAGVVIGEKMVGGFAGRLIVG